MVPSGQSSVELGSANAAIASKPSQPSGERGSANALIAGKPPQPSPLKKLSYAASASKILTKPPTASQSYSSNNGSSVSQPNPWKFAGENRRKRGCNVYGKGNINNGKQLGMLFLSTF